MSELAVIKQENILTTFVGDGLDPIIQKIKDEVNSFVPDLSTEKGRTEIASLAYKVSTSKTYLDKLGKDLSTPWSTKVKAVNESRKKMREELDALRDSVRKPLTDYEDAEKNRIENVKNNLLEIRGFKDIDVTDFCAKEIEELISKLNGIAIHGLFAEFEERALEDKAESLASLSNKLEKQVAFEEQQAENARLKKEAEEREQKEKEEKIAREAKEKAEKEAAEKARLEKERVEKEKKDAEEKAAKEKAEAIEAKEKAEREAVEREAKAIEAKEKAEREAVEAKERAEKEKILAAEKADREAKEAKEKAEKEKQEAVEAEKKRQEDERKKEEDRKRKLEEDEKHRNEVHDKVIKSLVENGLLINDAKRAVEIIKTGKVFNLRIEY